MRDYKDETIEKLCKMLNYLDDCGCMTEDDVKLYHEIMTDYTADKATEEILDKCLLNDCAYYSNCYILRNKEDGEIIVKSYNKERSEVMMHDVSKQICFSDCDDTYGVIKIMYRGREVEYTGWQPGMIMSYKYTETGDAAWSGCFPQWEH